MFEDISKVILLSDMDGTLLTSQKKISDADISAIRKFTQLGGKFTIATGRTIQSFEAYRNMLELKMPVILYNGCAIFDYNENKLLYSTALPKTARQITKKFLAEMPQIGGEVLKADGTYVYSNNEYQQLHTRVCGITPNYCGIDEVPEGDWLKVLFAMSPEDILHAEKFAEQNQFEDVAFVKSSEIFLEMLPLGITKGSALDEYRKLDGMQDFTFCAIGDFDNDLDMIINADLGAVPSNAEEPVKKQADLILGNSNDTGAVAELIDYIIRRCGL